MARAIIIFLACLFLACLVARADGLDDAARDLARRIAARLSPSETARLTTRNLSALPLADASRLQNALEIALRKRIRNPMPIEVAVTISENISGFLLIAEIHSASESVVEMVDFRYTPTAPQSHPVLSLQKQLLWNQDTPILDLVSNGTGMLVLDSSGVTVYESVAGKWERVARNAVEFMPVRDPRGRLEVEGESIRIQVPGKGCSGVWKPAIALDCTNESEFTAARNTLDFKDWRGAFYQSAHIGETYLVGELDGRIHVYDESHAAKGVIDEWGDFAAVTSTCGQYFMASSASDSPAGTIALYQVSNFAPVRVSEPLDFPGPVTGIWPAGNRAIAILNDGLKGTYAAYAVTANCGP